ncbi:2-deoxy-D-gluconate 3-dehydrogenase [Rubrivirga marina]|uniref:2-deoxy-D-gluconate 3-dehydrogenase n=2 Tax=Rubrivirga marina TaxID=1196024 RepID=A0A271J574_9BACT|nr:2-deoxy-D-gluconate 3-dehydrogenase [Rubrivirga marina]
MFSLAGTTAMVTGASRGIGRALAVALAGAGADVVCASTRRSGTDETAEAVRQEGRRAWQVEADLSSPDGPDRLADAAFELAGEVDVLVNNAGTIRRHPAESFPLGDWEHVVQTNLTAVFRLSQRVAEPMLARGRGKILNVASLLSFQGGVTVPAYTASKHGVAGLTKALANEWAPSGVTVNAIAPGYIATDNTQALQDDETRSRQILERIPAGRWGDPADLGGAAVFLASPASDYVNGHVLVVDGGWMAR